MLFFLQRDSHSAGCTRQTPPNRVSADSPSRILPGDIMVSLRSPPPGEVTMLQVAERKFSDIFPEVFLGRSKIKKRARDHLLARGNIYYSVPQRFVVLGQISCSTKIRVFFIPSFQQIPKCDGNCQTCHHMEHLIYVSNNENNYSYSIGVITCFPPWPPCWIHRRVPCHSLPQDRTRQTET